MRQKKTPNPLAVEDRTEEAQQIIEAVRKGVTADIYIEGLLDEKNVWLDTVDEAHPLNVIYNGLTIPALHVKIHE